MTISQTRGQSTPSAGDSSGGDGITDPGSDERDTGRLSPGQTQKGQGSIGELVHAARVRAGLSMNELASRAETSVSTISRIESGKFDPRWSTLEAIFGALGTSLADEQQWRRRILQARYRNRIANVFTAARLVAPSYDPVDLWTLLEGTTVGGKPLSEELAARTVLRAYDHALGEAVRTAPGTQREAVEAGERVVAGGGSLAEGVATATALLAVWTGHHIDIPGGIPASSIATVHDAAARYTKPEDA